MFSLIKAVPCFLLLAAGVSAQARQLAPSGYYNQALKYAAFVKASTSDYPVCKSPPFGSVVVQAFNITSTDTQATLFRLDSNKELIVAYPGTNSTVDYITDLSLIPLPYPAAKNCSLCLVHNGFAKAFTSIAGPLEAAIQKAVTANPTYTITVTGGSLGGALAKLTFDYFKDTKSYGSKVTNAWSFGEPRVGNKAFADYSDALSGATDSNIGIYKRVTHQNDLVPQIPPILVGFWHSRTEIWEQNDSTGKPSAATMYRCFGQEPLDCVNGQGSVSVEAHGSYAGYDQAVCGSK